MPGSLYTLQDFADEYLARDYPGLPLVSTSGSVVTVVTSRRLTPELLDNVKKFCGLKLMDKVTHRLATPREADQWCRWVHSEEGFNHLNAYVFRLAPTLGGLKESADGAFVSVAERFEKRGHLTGFYRLSGGGFFILPLTQDKLGAQTQEVLSDGKAVGCELAASRPHRPTARELAALGPEMRSYLQELPSVLVVAFQPKATLGGLKEAVLGAIDQVLADLWPDTWLVFREDNKIVVTSVDPSVATSRAGRIKERAAVKGVYLLATLVHPLAQRHASRVGTSRRNGYEVSLEIAPSLGGLKEDPPVEAPKPVHPSWKDHRAFRAVESLLR